jgi:hypothetical protein
MNYPVEIASSGMIKLKKKGKAIPVTGREGPLGCETSRLPHFLDNRLTDGGEVVSPMRRPDTHAKFHEYQYRQAFKSC